MRHFNGIMEQKMETTSFGEGLGLNRLILGLGFRDVGGNGLWGSTHPGPRSARTLSFEDYWG